MNNNTLRPTQSVSHFILNNVLMVSLLITITTPALASDSYQHKMLFTPNTGMLMAENKGRIMIYDGMNSDVIDVALNEQFDRIENMMFVRVVNVQADGEEIVDEDDCD